MYIELYYPDGEKIEVPAHGIGMFRADGESTESPEAFLTTERREKCRKYDFDYAVLHGQKAVRTIQAIRDAALRVPDDDDDMYAFMAALINWACCHPGAVWRVKN